MRQEWKTYFETIKLPEQLQTIIENKIQEVQSLFDVNIEDIFVSNRRNEQKIEYISLWLFSNDRVFECKNFISLDDYDMAPIGGNIPYVNVQKTNYSQISSPTEDSVLTISCYVGRGILSCTLNAAGINCKYLINILKSRFNSNFAKV